MTDSKLTRVGREQVLELRGLLEESGFLETVCLIAHSPLVRAKETCYEALRPTERDVPVEGLECLREASFYRQSKYAYDTKRALQGRFHQLHEWLSQQQQCSTVVLVGHSEYFRALLNQKTKFRNCDVWKATYHGNGQWTDPVLVHRLDSAPKEVL